MRVAVDILVIICNIFIIFAVGSLLIKTPLPTEITLGNKTYTIDTYKLLVAGRKSE